MGRLFLVVVALASVAACKHSDGPPDVIVTPPFVMADSGLDATAPTEEVACAVLAHFSCKIGLRPSCAAALREIRQQNPELGVDPACMASCTTTACLHGCHACEDQP